MAMADDWWLMECKNYYELVAGYWWLFVMNDKQGLVGGIPTPMKNMKISWDDYSQYMESHKIHVPNR